MSIQEKGGREMIRTSNLCNFHPIELLNGGGQFDVFLKLLI